MQMYRLIDKDRTIRNTWVGVTATLSRPPSHTVPPTLVDQGTVKFFAGRYHTEDSRKCNCRLRPMDGGLLNIYLYVLCSAGILLFLSSVHRPAKGEPRERSSSELGDAESAAERGKSALSQPDSRPDMWPDSNDL
jgi:hypothetical protein